MYFILCVSFTNLKIEILNISSNAILKIKRLFTWKLSQNLDAVFFQKKAKPKTLKLALMKEMVGRGSQTLCLGPKSLLLSRMPHVTTILKGRVQKFAIPLMVGPPPLAPRSLVETWLDGDRKGACEWA